jgi:hemoglobin/transferrin/lactoferrin receptor protein
LGGEDGLEETPIVDSEADSEELHYNGTPAWNVFNLGVGFQITPQIKIQGFIENLFDIHYREFASGISAPGRSLTVMGRINL